jgi:hypothetical protein
MTENTTSRSKFAAVSASELSGSLLVRKRASITEAGQRDPLSEHWEDPSVFSFIAVGRELLMKLETERSPLIRAQVIVDLTQAAKLPGRERSTEPLHANGNNETRIIKILLEKAQENAKPQYNGATRTFTLPPEIVINRSLFKKGAGLP